MLEGPSGEFWMGTDEFGRDILTRILYGARTALFIGFTAAIIGATGRLVLGVASAYFGGIFDLVVQRIVDVFIAFPLIIMALAVVAASGAWDRERDHRYHHPLHPAMRPSGAFECAGDSRDPLCRCSAGDGF